MKGGRSRNSSGDNPEQERDLEFIRSVVTVQRVHVLCEKSPHPTPRAPRRILTVASPAHTAACCSRCRPHVSHPAPSRPVGHALHAPALRAPFVTRRCLQTWLWFFTCHGTPFFAKAYRLSLHVYRHFGPELFVDSKGISSGALT